METRSHYFPSSHWLAGLSHEVKSLVLVAIIVVAYSTFRGSVLLQNIAWGWTYLSFVTLISVVGLGVKYPRHHPSITLVARSILAVFVVYLLLQKLHGLTPIEIEKHPSPTIAFILRYGGWLAIIAGIVGLWRPSAGFFCLAMVHAQKLAQGFLGGYYITWIDYLALVEVGQFLILCMLAGKVAGIMKDDTQEQRGSLRFPEIALLFGIAIHFANYFWSAVAKIVLPGGWTSWLTDNPTHALILAANEGGFSPLSTATGLAEMAYHFFSGPGVLLLNVVVLLSQFASVVAIAYRRAIISVTLIYDAQHIAIFLLTGIFFWKWILLNFAIVAAASMLRQKNFPRLTTICCMLMVVAAPMFFTIAKLGWYDTHSFNNLKITAVLKDGREIPLPSNYFFEYSVLFAQQYPGRPHLGHFSTLTYGATVDHEIFQSANSCAQTFDDQKLSQSPGREAAERLIRAHHQRLLRDENASVVGNFDLYPHHIWSNPSIYRDATRIDPREIVSYRMTVSSVCFEASPSGPRRIEQKESFYDIAL